MTGVEIETARLRLRMWSPDDVPAYARMVSDPEVMRHMGARMSADQAAAQIEGMAEHWRTGGFSQWAAVDRQTGRLIGRIGLLRHRDWPLGGDPVEIGWTLHRDWWGRGLATEGGRAAMECWRTNLPDEPQLISITTPANTRSRAVMERLGLTYRGAAHWHDFDVIWYAADRAPTAVRDP